MTDKATLAGQAVYSKNVLSLYDLWVLGFSNHYLWQCPTKLIAEQFSQHVSTNHLDVGVGSGYYLKRCLTDIDRRLALVDLNENSLAKASSEIARFKPKCYQRNVFEPLTLDGENFDTISINYLLHCLPGNMTEKGKVFENLKAVLNDGGVVFGSTILGKHVEKNFFADKLMNLYNSKGIFTNLADDISGLDTVLHQHFSQVKIRVVGCVALFVASQ